MCLRPDATDYVINEMIEREKCAMRERVRGETLERALAAPPPTPKAWWENPQVMIGGVAVGVGVGMVLGYFLRGAK